MNDSYRLPCVHTFRLRPCLLSHAEAVTVCCIYCHVEFDAAELRPNCSVEAQLRLLSMRRGQEQEQKQPMEDSGIGEKAGGTPHSVILCSTCRKQVQSTMSVFCHHCQCQVCVPCSEKHRDSVSINDFQILFICFPCKM